MKFNRQDGSVPSCHWPISRGCCTQHLTSSPWSPGKRGFLCHGPLDGSQQEKKWGWTNYENFKIPWAGKPHRLCRRSSQHSQMPWSEVTSESPREGADTPWQRQQKLEQIAPPKRKHTQKVLFFLQLYWKSIRKLKTGLKKKLFYSLTSTHAKRH